ncbi:hypothetical protein EKK58_07505 [Candidatus Dependentiae bacterium]|nr:MAG: hypothetical protein EKK58_07505 [Candidatus Dependentiae bacterium]
MAVPWPATIQDKLERDNFALEKGSTVIRTQMDVGPYKVRRRSTRPIDVLTGSIYLTASEWAVFETFYDTTINGGVTPFELPHPITGALTVFRFAAEPSYRSVGSIFIVSMKWEVMP